MAKKTIKRFLPSPAKLREIRSLRMLGSWIYQPQLWQINRNSTSTAFFVGLFCAFIPVPTQMIFAAVIAVAVRCNLPLSVALCWITNPLTMPPIFFLAYKVGAVVMGVTPQSMEFQLSWDWITHSLVEIWQPFLLGCLICGLFFGSVGFVLVRALWRWSAVRRWQERARQRRNRIRRTIHDVARRQEEISQHAEPDTRPPAGTSPRSPGQ